MASRRARQLVAFAGHAPGLWLAFHEPVPRALWAMNACLLLLTAAAAVGAAVMVDGAARWPAAVGIWAAGHTIWGVVLAVRLPEQPPG
jgi:hypothetical protein